MGKRDILEIGIKLIGLYCVHQTISGLSSLVFLLSRPEWHEKNQPSWALVCLPIAVYLAMAMTFVFKGRSLAELLIKDTPTDHTATPASAPAWGQLSFWLRLLGFFFLVPAVSSLISAIIRFAAEGATLSWKTPHFVGEIVTLLLSLALVFWNRRIASFVEERSDKSSAGTPPGC